MKQIQIYGTEWNVGHPSENSYATTEVTATIRATTLLSCFTKDLIQQAHKEYVAAYLAGDFALEEFIDARLQMPGSVFGRLLEDGHIYAFPSIKRTMPKKY